MLRSSSVSLLRRSMARYVSSGSAQGKLFDKLLVANRGEIACRVMRTAKRLGIKTVAVYSDADAGSQHVAMADEAVRIGPAPARESYLQADIIVEAAKKTGAQAVHPGYGFLSENESFSKNCKEHGIEFIGPPEKAIHDMGSKSESKIIMTKAGVPVTPGYWGDEQSPARLQQEAEAIGYPVMIKAVMGGGGKGMRIVRSAEEFVPALEACQREARSSFGDDRVLLERYLTVPRHVELQVFADKHGNAVYLYERDCSVQRRHQKVLEEAPAPGLDMDLRARMGGSAVDAALAVGYVGAGTVEFMLDHDRSYYFMEMNTRLQVEHPVTEMITGLDLVEWQIRVAAGQRLPLNQEQIMQRVRGHAIEARVYAENPSNNFLPATGLLKHLSAPTQTPNVRVDTGVRQGDAVSIYYDPMISKLIVWGETRADALRHMKAALHEYQVVGLPNNIEFLGKCVSHPLFQQGGVDTSFLGHHLQECLPAVAPVPAEAVALAALSQSLKAVGSTAPTDPWRSGDASRPGVPATSKTVFAFKDEVGAAVRKGADTQAAPPAKGKPGPDYHSHACASVSKPLPPLPLAGGSKPANTFEIAVGTGKEAVCFSATGTLTPCDEEVAAKSAVAAFKAATKGKKVKGVTADNLVATINGSTYKATVVTVTGPAAGSEGTEVHIFPESGLPAHSYKLTLPSHSFGSSSSKSGGAAVMTPMPGKVVKVMAKPGDAVKEGQPLMILEAMKMEHVIKAPANGTVASVGFKEGEFVEDGKVLVAFSV